MTAGLELVAQAIDLLHGARYQLLPETLNSETVKAALIRGVMLIEDDVHVLRPFRDGDRLELFSFGPLGVLGPVYLDVRGFVLGDDEVLDVKNFSLLVMTAMRFSEAWFLVTKKIPQELRLRVGALVASEIMTARARLMISTM